MKKLVAYYTFQGHTQTAARELCALVDGDLRRIEEAKPRKKSSFLGAALSAILGRKSKLKPMDWKLTGYYCIFLGVQVWASHSTPPVNAFVNQCDWKGKKVYLFSTQANPLKPQKVFDGIAARIEAKGGKVLGSCSIQTKMKEPLDPAAARDTLTEWVKTLEIN